MTSTVACGLWLAVSHQDVPVSVNIILQEWRAHEISDEDVVHDLIQCRSSGADAALREVDYLIARARTEASTSSIE